MSCNVELALKWQVVPSLRVPKPHTVHTKLHGRPARAALAPPASSPLCCLNLQTLTISPLPSCTCSMIQNRKERNFTVQMTFHNAQSNEVQGTKKFKIR